MCYLAAFDRDNENRMRTWTVFIHIGCTEWKSNEQRWWRRDRLKATDPVERFILPVVITCSISCIFFVMNELRSWTWTPSLGCSCNCKRLFWSRERRSRILSYKITPPHNSTQITQNQTYVIDLQVRSSNEKLSRCAMTDRFENMSKWGWNDATQFHLRSNS